MPWTQQNVITFSVTDAGRYRRFQITNRASGLIWAVELETPLDSEVLRLRTGFLATGALIAGRELFGASEELFRGDDVGQRGLFILDWRWLDVIAVPSVDITQYQCRIAPDRGALPATARLLRYAA